MERIKLDIQRFAVDPEITIKVAARVEEMAKAFIQAEQKLNSLKKQVSVVKVGVDAFGTSIGKLATNVFNVGKALNSWNLSGVTKQISSLGNSLYKDFLTKAIDTSEELNLFNVVFNNIEKNGKTTFSELGKQAVQFQNELNEAFGTNKKETMRYQGLFQAMGESAGLDDKTAGLMSKNMTKLAYDLASLYNTTETRAAEALRAGVYAGQTKPLRNYGIDVTQTSYKPLLEELGIEKSVNELTQAEKEILRYIATLNQAKNAMGDFANTLESPANQLKVLRQQFYEMQAAIGNLFVGAFARILPYVNAIIMVIKELAKTIAAIFGIRMKDYNSGIATYEDGLEDYSEGLDDIAGSAGSASDAIKALKRQTLAFDQINNLTSPTPSGSSGGGGGGSIVDGIDQRLLDALKGYENGMEKVRMKAVEIRDKIMEWLGFQKQINEETHETYFTYDTTNKTIVQIAKEIATNLANMLNYYTNRIDWAELGHYLAIGLNTAFGFIDTFIQNYDWKNLGTQIANFVNKAIEETDFSTIGRVLTDKLRIAILTLSGFIQQFDFEEFAKKLADLINSAIQNIPVSELASGLNSLVNGIWTTIKTLAKEINWGELVDTVFSLFNELDWGAKFLLIAPAVASGLAVLFGSSLVQDIISQLIVRAIANGILNGNISAGISGAGASAAGSGASLSGLGYAGGTALGIYLDIKGYKTTSSQLDDLFSGKPVDLTLGVSNEKGFWENAGTAFMNALSQLTFFTSGNGMLGKALVGKELVSSLSNNGLGGTLENFFGSIEGTFGLNEGTLYNVYVKPFQGLVDTIDKATGKYNNFANVVSEVGGVIKEVTFEVTDDIKENAEEYFNVMIETDKQQRILKAATEGNYEEIQRIINETTEESAASVRQSLIDQTNAVQGELGPELLNQWSILAYGSRDNYKEGIKQLPEDLQDRIQAATGVIVSATPGVVQYFEDLGSLSEEDMMNELKKLPKDLQQEIIDKMKEKGVKIPQELQAGIDSEPDPNVEVTTDEYAKIQAYLNNQISRVGGQIPVGVSLPSSLTIQNALNSALSGANAILKITKQADGGVFANGHWQPIQAYANGGMPSGGSLFMAREAGPELVGKIGRHTAVMNNNQIVDSVKAGVYEAVSAAMSEGGMGQVQIDLHTDEGVVVDRINKVTRQTGVCPIEI